MKLFFQKYFFPVQFVLIEKKVWIFSKCFGHFPLKKTFMFRNVFRTFLSRLSYKYDFWYFGKSIPKKIEVIAPWTVSLTSVLLWKLCKFTNFSCHLVALSRIIGECFPQNLMLLGGETGLRLLNCESRQERNSEKKCLLGGPITKPMDLAITLCPFLLIFHRLTNMAEAWANPITLPKPKLDCLPGSSFFFLSPHWKFSQADLKIWPSKRVSF